MGEADIAEWTKLLGLASRDSVKQQIQLHLDALVKHESILTPVPPKKIVSPSPEAATSTHTEFIALTNFAWDQTSTNVKIYITLEGVDSVPSQNISAKFNQQAVRITVEGVNKRNYRLNIKRLAHPIKEAECRYKVKHDGVTVTLAKERAVQWGELVYNEAKQTKRPMPDVRAEEDPGSSIMNMMKNLYEEGDDEMKRTIAKAWTEANDKKLSGKHAGPDGGWGEDSLA